jgi:hypothetical protein
MDDHHDSPIPGSNAEAYGVRGYLSDEVMNNIAPSSSRNSPFSGTVDDMQLLESGLYRKQYGDNMGDDYYRFQGEAGKSVDPRLLPLLEFFRELFVCSRRYFRGFTMNLWSCLRKLTALSPKFKRIEGFQPCKGV